MDMSGKPKCKGFTLIELLVVMAIIATLLSIVAPRYFNSLDKAKEAVLRQDLGICLLYTSDAADERSSVDLGGRRIIKKKNN